MTQEELLAVANAYVECYNSDDLATMKTLMSEDVEVTHHNRGVHRVGRDIVFAGKEGAAAVIPDKHFRDRRRIVAFDDVVLIEHTWAATAKADMPGFAKAGESIELELCTVMTIRDGEIVKYDDYG
ncbi:hypothetical protein GCM10009555_020020 [Acrocarpospora macrocephala]|uniref:SnoaL-like domain-containing protein n=1 Tax=Acrocarpospora macrocephala TaxID=150177 RepID=A0A5M3WNZ3_9ACTN|nr:nuclear transport factor 2 family protein [Acrocarpospora macrocephala]GES07998.1 hypothetical protein Amac_015930 [Acrocarpospora macrocephala]